MKTRTMLIGAVVLVTLGLGSTWAWIGRRPGSVHEAERIVRDAQSTAAAAATRDATVGPVPAPVPYQDAAARLDALDTWFAAWRGVPPPAPSGDPLKDDAVAVARVQARGRTLVDLMHAYEEHADDEDPAIAARARSQLGEIHLTIANDLKTLPVPGYLAPEQKAAFRENMARRVADEENRAAEEKEVAVALLDPQPVR